MVTAKALAPTSIILLLLGSAMAVTGGLGILMPDAYPFRVFSNSLVRLASVNIPSGYVIRIDAAFEDFNGAALPGSPDPDGPLPLSAFSPIALYISYLNPVDINLSFTLSGRIFFWDGIKRDPWRVSSNYIDPPMPWGLWVDFYHSALPSGMTSNVQGGFIKSFYSCEFFGQAEAYMNRCGATTPQLVFDNQGMKIDGTRIISGDPRGKTFNFFFKYQEATLSVYGNTINMPINALSPPPPVKGTVTIFGGDGQVFSNVQPTDTITTKSPVKFRADITQGEPNKIWVSITKVGETTATYYQLPLVVKMGQSGGYPWRYESQSITLVPGTYYVTVYESDRQDVPRYVFLSFIGYFDSTVPTPFRASMFSVAMLVIGLIIIGLGMMMRPRRTP